MHINVCGIPLTSSACGDIIIFVSCCCLTQEKREMHILLCKYFSHVHFLCGFYLVDMIWDPDIATGFCKLFDSRLGAEEERHKNVVHPELQMSFM